MIEIRLPKPGPEIEEATITSWECAEGDKILIGDILAIIKTPIGSFKVAAEEQGILESILQAKGDKINFEEPIAVLRPELTISDFKDTDEYEGETLPFPGESEDEADTGTLSDEEEDEDFIESAGDSESAEDEPIQVESIDKESVQEESESLISDEPSDFSIPDEHESAIDLPETDEETPPLQPEETIPFDEAVPFEKDEEEPAEVPEPDAEAGEIAESEDEADEPDVAESYPEEAEAPVSDSEDTNHSLPDNLEFEISPAAMKLADQAGIDLDTVKGSGENGKIHYIDVENAIWERAKTNQTKEKDSQPEVEPGSEWIAEEEISANEPENCPDSGQEASDSGSSNTEDEPYEPALPEQESIPENADVADNDLYTADDGSFDPEESESPEEAIHSGFYETDEETPAEVAQAQVPEIFFSKAKPSPDFDEISIQFNMDKKDDLIIPFNTVKKAYSETQTESHRSVPQLNLFAEVDFTNACKWRKEYNAENKTEITITDLIVKVCGHALALMPEINAYVRPDRIILKRSINIGVTTSMDEGVVTPVVPDVYRKSLNKVSEIIKKNTSLAAKSKVVLDYDSAFTVSNLGMYGVKRFIPLVTAPQSACLGVGEISKKVVPVNDFAGIRSIMELTFACDHRAIDGTTAAKFIQIIRSNLESLTAGDDPDWIKENEQLRLI
jgi:pyruvate/2-oxoglutarate dehydrogenase complex dihydrolipoamide acyltransferase (E2) component